MRNFFTNHVGLSLVEVVLAVAILLALAGVGYFTANPRSELMGGRNTLRFAHVNALLNAVRQNIRDHRTGFSCVAGAIPTSTKFIGSASSSYDMASCIVPDYLQGIPFDAQAPNAHYRSLTDYATGYTIVQNASTGQITIAAPYSEGSTTISVSR